MAKVIGEWREKWKCALCHKDMEGYGSNPAPVMDYNSALVCSDCNSGVVVPFRLIKQEMGYNDIQETIDRNFYNKFVSYCKNKPQFKPLQDFLAEYFEGTDIDKITDPVDYGDLVESE